MRQLITKEDILKGFTFHYDDLKTDTDIFFCKCGHITRKNRQEVATEMKISIKEGAEITDFTNLFDGENMARFTLLCENCGVDYSTKETSGLVQYCGTKFFEAYCFQEDENDVKLLKQRFIAEAESKNQQTNEPAINLEETLSWIRFNKESKILYFKEFDKEEKSFNLDSVMSNVNSFFLADESKVTERLFDVHLFVDRMANFVADSHNINIIDELMNQMVGKSGLDIITKVTSIFLGIICYSNLSTIALTKGTMFLFDMMNDCQLPNPQELSDNNATSPLKIFNYLVNYKNEEISKELDANDKSKVGYVYKAKDTGREMTFKFDASRFDKNRQTDNTKDGMFLREDITKKSVSPYIFNTIERFTDYKIIIKYTKFISYTELVELVRRNNINLLINLWSSLEYRADMNLNNINQIVSLAISSLERIRLLGFHRTTSDLKFQRNQFINSESTENKEIDIETEVAKVPLNYSLLNNFDLTIYDDSLRMLRALAWDVNKEFSKIKTMDELESYHDKLSEYFNMLSSEQKNKDFVDFVFKYKVLEEYDKNLKVRLIKTPESLLTYAKKLKNCAGSYVIRVADAQYLLCMVEDIDPNRPEDEISEYMLGMTANKYGKLEFDQIKGACNKQGTDRFKQNVMEFLQEKEISYKELADIRLSTSRTSPVESNLEALINELQAQHILANAMINNGVRNDIVRDGLNM